jgi:hypothetical protein
MIIGETRQMAGITQKNRIRGIIVRAFAFLFAVFGVWASFDRDMFSKLFFGFSFDYWPEERPAVLFFAVMLSIMGVYVFIIVFHSEQYTTFERIKQELGWIVYRIRWQYLAIFYSS